MQTSCIYLEYVLTINVTIPFLFPLSSFLSSDFHICECESPLVSWGARCPLWRGAPCHSSLEYLVKVKEGEIKKGLYNHNENSSYQI